MKLEGTVLYADLDGSTNMVDEKPPEFAAEIYKTYLHCAAKIIRSEDATITSYDGDRVMAVFIGGRKNTTAARCALKINYAVKKIINPAIKRQYSNCSFQVKQIVGIDTSDSFVARTGIRNWNDLVWVGRSANYAAKLCSQSRAIRHGLHPVFTTACWAKVSSATMAEICGQGNGGVIAVSGRTNLIGTGRFDCG